MAEQYLYPAPLHGVLGASSKFKRMPRKPKEEVVKEQRNNINDSWITTVSQKVDEVRPCTIFRCPEKFHSCDQDDKIYGPLITSIGPYHYFPYHQTKAYAIQEHKWRCVRYLLSRHRSRDYAGQLLDICLAALRTLDGEVRSCYSENLSHFDSPQLTSIMLTDSCFIIYLLLKQVENKRVVDDEEAVVVEEGSKEKERDKGKTVKVEGGEEERVQLKMGICDEELDGPVLGTLWVWDLKVFDLLKFENQIPFFVIEIIFNILKIPADETVDLINLALQLFRDIHPSISTAFMKRPTGRFYHLLHLFHSSIVPYKPPLIASASPEWIPSATELAAAGVKFEKKEAAESLLDVSLIDGRMEIPPLLVNEYTDSLFRNLIIFEQCFPDVGMYVTNYAMFMECIICLEEDVTLLVSTGIVVNRLSNNESVVDLFNWHNNQLQYAFDKNYLADVFVKAKAYHKFCWHK